MHLAEIVRHHAATRPDHPALRWEGGELTWAALGERSDRAGQALRAAGVDTGDRVAYLDRNAPELFELLFGAAKLGAVLVPLNFRLGPGELRDIVADARVRLWVVGAEYAELAAGVIAELPEPVQLWVVDDLRARLDAAEAQDPGYAAADDDVALLLYSSGTTGEPKGIELTDANLAACVGDWDELMGIGAPDAVCLAPLPLFHVGGLTWALVGLRFGTTTVLVRDPLPDRVLDVLERERVTHAGLVPALMQAMLAVPGVRDRDFGALRAVLYGASPITETLLRNLLPVFGCDFYQAYGSTETTAAVVVLAAADHTLDGRWLRSCGRPVPGVSVRVVDPVSGEDVKDGDTGEFWISGPNVMRGYFGRPELTAATVTDGWFHSGDVGYRDPDGYLFLRDRTKDVIISGAENIYPTEVENALAAHPAVAECAVIGVPSERWGETPLAVVVRAPDSADLEADTLIAHCRERLAHYKCPTAVEFVDELPRNPTGKVLKRELRAPHWSDQDRSI